MLAAPAPSATVRVKVCEKPEPEAGSAERTAGGPELGTVQEPVVIQPVPLKALS